MRNNTAYDLTRFAPAQQEAARVRVVKTSRGNKAAYGSGGLLKKLILLVITAVLMIGTVYSRTELNETKASINSLKSELTELESQNAYLNYRLESTVSVKVVEDYASSELGLIRADSSMINYVNLQGANRIVSEESGKQNLFETCIDGVMDFIGE